MSIGVENKLFHQLKQNDYILFKIERAFADALDQLRSSSAVSPKSLPELSFYQRFKASWNDLKPDPYLIEGGTFRLRRYAVLTWQNGILQLVRPEAHFQSKQYNRVYGGINRVFAPITPAVLQSAFLKIVIEQTILLLDAKAASTWRVQCHQFRINASFAEAGQPTPEGLHQDGSDYVFIMLLERQGIMGGVSELFDSNKQRIATTVLKQDGDAILLNDKVLWHSVTNIQPTKDAKKGHRDVLVLTFHHL
jgi:hypothetical protein